MFCQLDLGGRPSETLALTRDKVTELQGRQFPRHAVVPQPHPDAKVEKGAVRNTRASKQGAFDDTVFPRMDGSANGVLTKQLQTLRSQSRHGEPLFAPLTLDAYERQIKMSVQ